MICFKKIKWTWKTKKNAIKLKINAFTYNNPYHNSLFFMDVQVKSSRMKRLKMVKLSI